MPFLYESYAKKSRLTRRRVIGQEEVETIIDVPFPSTMGGTCFEYSEVAEEKVLIKWNPKEIKVLGISLRGSAGSDFPFPGAFYIDLFLYVNDNLVVTKRFRWGGSASWDTDIAAHIKNGWNTFKAEIKKPGCNAWVKGLDVYVSFYSNVIPEHRTEEEQLMRYIKYGVISAVVIGGLFVGIKAIAALRRGKT